VGGSVFRGWLSREAMAVDMLDSPVVCVKRTHHIEADPLHEKYKHKISTQYETEK
jgi:hypothetical protein